MQTVSPGATQDVQTEGVGVGREGEVALGLQLFRGGFEGVPVFDFFAHRGRIIGTKDVLRNIPPVDQKARAALPGGAALDPVLVRSGGLGEGVLVGQVGVGVDAQVGQGHGHVGLGVGVFVDVVGLGQEDVHLVVGGAGCLVQQSFIQLLLVDAVLVGVDDPVDLGAVFQGGDGAVGRSAGHFRINGFQTGAELVVPAVDIDHFAFRRSLCAAARCSSGIPAASGQNAGSAHGAGALQERAAADGAGFLLIHSTNLLCNLMARASVPGVFCAPIIAKEIPPDI